MVIWQVVMTLCLMAYGSEAATSLKCRSSYQMVGHTGRLACEMQPVDALVFSIHWEKCIVRACNEILTHNAEVNKTEVKGSFKTKQVAHSYKHGLVVMLLYNTTKDEEGMYEVTVKSAEDDYTGRIYYVVVDAILGPEKRVGSATETMTTSGHCTSEKTILISGLALALCVIVFLIVFIVFRKRMTRSLCFFKRNRHNPTPESEEQSRKMLSEDDMRMIDESSQTIQKQAPKRFLSLPAGFRCSGEDGDAECKEFKTA